MAWSTADLSYKILINRRATNSAKQYYEEFGDYTINTHLLEVWSDPIPSTPAAISGIIQQYTNFKLIPDQTVAGNMTYIAVTNPTGSFSFAAPDDVTNPRLKDWISPKYGTGYEISLYANGNQIFPTDSTYPWFFNYQTGILTFNTSTPTTPITISAYRYIGKKGVSSTDNLTGTTNSYWQIDKNNNGIRLDNSSGNLIIYNPTAGNLAKLFAGEVSTNTLVINSSILVNNLNANYLSGKTLSYFATDGSLIEYKLNTDTSITNLITNVSINSTSISNLNNTRIPDTSIGVGINFNPTTKKYDVSTYTGEFSDINSSISNVNDKATNLIIINDNQPDSSYNKIWIDTDDNTSESDNKVIITGGLTTSTLIVTAAQNTGNTNYPTLKSVADVQIVTVTDTTSTAITANMLNNYQYQYGLLSSLTITLPTGNFTNSIAFSSGNTATSIIYPNNIKWIGSNVINNSFIPATNKRYNIVFWFDGVNINGVVGGI